MGSYRRIYGEGHLERSESIWSANGSWRLRDEAVFSVYGSRRQSAQPVVTARDDVLGLDLTFEPRDLLQLRGTWKQARRYAAGSCDACHAGPETLQAQGAELCVTCHSARAAGTSGPFAHAAVTSADACLSCHQPHTGRTKSLLQGDNLAEACFSCHDRSQFAQKNTHPDGLVCSTCHAPHGTGQARLLLDKQSRLCGQCHDAGGDARAP